MAMTSYFLAVDAGTSRTAASTARLGPDGALSVATFGLGRNSDSTSSAIFVAEDDLLFGEAAERRGLAQPERLIREFKRRIGDDVPIVVGEHRFTPEYLFARMVGWVVETVVAREGGPPAAIAATVPATWGGYRASLISSAIARELRADVQVITEPEAAARHYETTAPLLAGSALAVYDLGGGTFDAVVLRKEANGSIRIAGEPTGLADFGGADFDDAVLQHTILAAGMSTSELGSDPASRVALAALRRECVDAKEALSFDSEAVIPVLVAGASTTVRLTRSEFEDMIDAGVDRTIDVLATAVDSAGVEPDELQAILLTGGSSRIPRIAQLLSEHFDRPIAVDADPKAIVALGAARALADRALAAPTSPALVPLAGFDLATAAVGGAGREDPETPSTAVAVPGELVLPAPTAAPRRWFTRMPAAAAMAGGVILLSCGVIIATAAELGSGAISAQAEPETLTEWLGLEWVGDSAAAAPAPAAAVGPTTEVAAPTTPGPSTPRSNPRREAIERLPDAPRSIAAPAPTAPLSAAGSGTPNPVNPPHPAANPPAGEPVADPGPDPTTPPADPDPTTPPVDPDPTTPPVDPDPSDPPADPGPTDPPADPGPSEPPADPPAETPVSVPDPTPSPGDPV